ncbi:hypothetical protein O185_07615 [Photorhabdus temperata J3]|uniref:Uncharacterized protein n=1 Tax=Photorhabdus temperata J3 TaxID=1389415 RepID=U7R4E0_PHOTE|nr:hypothetical protein O185_07615 [Photorhabdus temperata J3]
MSIQPTTLLITCLKLMEIDFDVETANRYWLILYGYNFNW